MSDGEIWRREYETNRYLEKIDGGALERRREHILRNLWSTDRDGYVTPPRFATARRGMLRLLLHTMLEQMARDGIQDCLFDEATLREDASAGYMRPILTTPYLGPPDCYTKYGQREHIREDLNAGRLRICPASAYNDDSLNAAQQDDELIHAAITAKKSIVFQLYGLDKHGSVRFPSRQNQWNCFAI
ncbi:hypothetical protein [Xanthobacter versatilis]|uniref:hypothetical protein n=1 Tax=Xanthobacter autotrophicus (strain ATCC BAA-1158 / Py2) TaxID=78245 RepID=UPI0037274D62